MVDGNFTVSIEYEDLGDGTQPPAYIIIINSGHHSLIVDFKNNVMCFVVFIIICSLIYSMLVSLNSSI